MGTRSSRHNKGRKPLYKEHGTDSARFFVERVPQIVSEHPSIPFRHAPRPAPNPELEDRVRRYLEARKAAAEAERIVEELRVAAVRRTELREAKVIETMPIVEQYLVSVSDRDISLQLYVEKKISINQLHCARLWQHYVEEHTLQPSQSIDASAPDHCQPWQRDGDMTEAQYRAVMIRKLVAGPLGQKRVRFLDIILQPDVGRTQARILFRAPWDRIQYELLWCLDALSIYFGRTTGFPGDGMDGFREAAEKQMKYRTDWARQIFEQNYTEGHSRHLQYLDAEAHHGAKA